MVVTLSVVGEGPAVNMPHMDVPRDAVSASRSLSTFIFGEVFFRWCIIPGIRRFLNRIPVLRSHRWQSKSFRMLPRVVSRSRLLPAKSVGASVWLKPRRGAERSAATEALLALLSNTTNQATNATLGALPPERDTRYMDTQETRE